MLHTAVRVRPHARLPGLLLCGQSVIQDQICDLGVFLGVSAHPSHGPCSPYISGILLPFALSDDAAMDLYTRTICGLAQSIRSMPLSGSYMLSEYSRVHPFG